MSIDEHIGKEFINNKTLQLTFFKEVGVKPSRSLSKITYRVLQELYQHFNLKQIIFLMKKFVTRFFFCYSQLTIPPLAQ